MTVGIGPETVTFFVTVLHPEQVDQPSSTVAMSVQRGSTVRKVDAMTGNVNEMLLADGRQYWNAAVEQAQWDIYRQRQAGDFVGADELESVIAVMRAAGCGQPGDALPI